ncbi:MAG: ABC transporter permease [Symbiobacteriia bacterium]
MGGRQGTGRNWGTSMRVLGLALRKEFQVWLRDPKVFAASVFAPLALLLAFNLMFGSGRALPIAVTDLDKSPASVRLVELLGSKTSQLGGKYFKVISAAAPAAQGLWAEQDVVAWLTIPQGFGANLVARRQSDLPLAIDNSNSDLAKNIRLYINEVVFDLYQDTYPEARLDIEERHEAGRKVSWIGSIGMGLVGLSIVLAGLFNGFNSLLSEYRSHTIKPLLLAPRPVAYSIAAKLAYATFGALLSGVLMLGLLHLLTGLSLLGGTVGFLLLASLSALTYVAIGMVIGLLVRQYMPAAGLSMVLGVTSWFLSGSLGSLKVYSRPIQVIATFLPVTYAQDGLRGLLLFGDLHSLWVNALYLAVWFTLAFAALVLTIRRRLALE